MKKVYETAQIDVFMFGTEDVIVASGIDVPSMDPTTTYFKENDETEML